VAVPKDPDTPLLSSSEIVTKPFTVTVVLEEVCVVRLLLIYIYVYICVCVNV
jgi:hypothetical protein